MHPTQSVRMVRSTGPVPVLYVVEGANAGRSIQLQQGEPLTIGSRDPAQEHIDDSSVSRLHCEFLPTDSGVRVRDLGSRNGTFLGPHQIHDAILGQNSQVRIGRTLLELRLEPRPQVRAVWDGADTLGGLYGASQSMQSLFAQTVKSAVSDSSVLIRGESGTGKELLARAIHDLSPRANAPFVVLDCGAISPHLVDSELFGHVRGSYTGATSDRAGAFERSEGGTIFLDEIGELPLELQPRLLRVIEQKSVRRVGGSDRVEVDFRVVAATHRSLESMVNAGSFRADLYYRLAVMQLRVPPLRDRPEDVPELARRFREADHLQNDSVKEKVKSALANRAGHPWPGNVRELRNFVQRAAVLDDPETADVNHGGSPLNVRVGVPFHEEKERWLGSLEREYVEKTLRERNGNISAAARTAGLSRNHFSRLVQKYNVRNPKGEQN